MKRIPSSTYRLQFNRDFDFSAATRILDYLRELGITDCYASPIFKPAPLSTHGYDICQFDAVNPHLGGEAGLREFALLLKERRMGLLLDMVPNHMGNHLSNPWWVDVLTNGRDSPYATWFDINWDPVGYGGTVRDQVLLPVLEDHYAKVLEAGKLKLAFKDRAFTLNYSGHEYPLSQESVRRLLASLDTFSLQPSAFSLQPEDPAFPTKIASTLETLNGIPGQPESFDQLHGIIQEQHYRLAFWRVAPHEINYRRFFDIPELVSMRMETPEVFNAAHKLLLSWMNPDSAATPPKPSSLPCPTALRIDHPDGLWDPRQYFQRLRDQGATYVVAEKILTGEEPLPEDWPVDGTTGYDFLWRVNALFVDHRNETAFDHLYQEFTGVEPGSLPRIISECKKLVLETSFPGDLNALAHRLRSLCFRTRYAKDFTFAELHRAISDLAIAFPIYRTYLTEDAATVSPSDQAAIQQAAATATSTHANPAPVEFIKSLLLLQFPRDLDDPGRRAARQFIMRFQQLTSPLMAKGLEDTAFYRFNRLLSLNEVGADSSRFGISPDQFHAYNKDKLRLWPHSLLATATHDTKRGEDLRARLNVLSEMPDLWAASLHRWKEMNHHAKSMIRGQPAPEPNDEYFIYQTLLGAWTPESIADPKTFRDRLAQCILKSIKESKRHTTWIDPNRPYEDATVNFITRILDPQLPNRFIHDFQQFHSIIAYHGCFNSLSQTLLKMTSPGVPDFYQGSELWDFNLVDPDNRRPPDYDLRQKLLRQLREDSATTNRDPLLKTLLSDWTTGRIKMFLTWQTLRFRNSHPDLFSKGEYRPLEVTGEHGENICALERMYQEKVAIVVVPRLTYTLLGGKQNPPLGPKTWGDTKIVIPEQLQNRHFEDVFTTEKKTPTENWPLADILSKFPVALLTTV